MLGDIYWYSPLGETSNGGCQYLLLSPLLRRIPSYIMVLHRIPSSQTASNATLLRPLTLVHRYTTGTPETCMCTIRRAHQILGMGRGCAGVHPFYPDGAFQPLPSGLRSGPSTNFYWNYAIPSIQNLLAHTSNSFGIIHFRPRTFPHSEHLELIVFHDKRHMDDAGMVYIHPQSQVYLDVNEISRSVFSGHHSIPNTNRFSATSLSDSLYVY